RFDPHLGRVGDRLAKIAEQEKADILVVGSHPRNALGRLWEGSVSRDTLRQAKVSVVCVPTLSERRTAAIPRMRSVLVATDFSDTANSAVPFAYSIVCYGGDVHLLHVVKGGVGASIEPSDLLESSSSGHPEERAALLALIPPDAIQQGKHSNAHIVASNDPAIAIAQVAERLGVDAICLGTHGRTGLPKALLGSVAQGLLGHTRRPLFFTHAAKV
ncbi:MAG TPA: universal stress protein, partial [Polyangiaceae bacterium]|nr:universal stress protein [Polyangiaceae bacterium]